MYYQTFSYKDAWHSVQNFTAVQPIDTVNIKSKHITGEYTFTFIEVLPSEGNLGSSSLLEIMEKILYYKGVTVWQWLTIIIILSLL